MLAKKLRISLSRYSFIETAILIFWLIFIGYFINSQDPILLEHEPMYVIVLLSIITLFHGVSNGMFAVFLIALVMKFYYPVFNLEHLLKISILVLILGEFHYYWNRKILQNKSRNEYLNTKLDELTKAFYTLKISHDQLEKNYVFKPMSIRNSIRKLKENFTEGEDFYKNFLILLDKSFNVSEAKFFWVEGKQLYYMNDTTIKYDSSDSMIELALAKKAPIYVSSSEVENNSQYLAVIPVVSQSRVKAVLLIEKMPFMSFNKDNLISISIIIAYFIDELDKWEITKGMNKYQLIDDEFYFELKRLRSIYEDFDVNSTILVLRTSDKLLAHLGIEKIRGSLRSLDMVSSHSTKDLEVIGVLFPFADRASARGFIKRLYSLLDINEYDKRIEYSLFDISQLDILKEYAGVIDA